jgi:hypothetical protein
VQSSPKRLRSASSSSIGTACATWRALSVPVDAREHLDVGGRQREVLEAQRRVGREAQGQVHVADAAGARPPGSLHAVDGLQDHVARGNLERRFLALDGDQRLEPVGAVRPREDPIQDLADLQRHPFLDALGGRIPCSLSTSPGASSRVPPAPRACANCSRAMKPWRTSTSPSQSSAKSVLAWTMWPPRKRTLQLWPGG